MIVFVYDTLNVKNKRTIWTISDQQFPKHLKEENITTVMSTSIETTYIINNLDVNKSYDMWSGEEAQYIFSNLKETFDQIF